MKIESKYGAVKVITSTFLVHRHPRHVFVKVAEVTYADVGCARAAVNAMNGCAAICMARDGSSFLAL